MYPVPWCDVLEIVPTDSGVTGLIVTGNVVDGNFEDNLCYKAWKLMAENYSIPPVKILLHKVIPSGAGLGGGSADAAFTLKMLNSMFRLALPADELRHLALQLGMDCPYFIDNVTSFSTARGEILQPAVVDVAGYYLLLVKPRVHVSTADAFSGVIAANRDNMLTDFTSLPVPQWKEKVHNDFERTVFAKHPEIESLKNKMYDNGAIYASMSGSGSAVYGLFTAEPQTDEYADCEVFSVLLGR